MVSDHIRYIIERISDILSFDDERKKEWGINEKENSVPHIKNLKSCKRIFPPNPVVLPDDVRNGIIKLSVKLSEYLTIVGKDCDRFHRRLTPIANSADEILDHISGEPKDYDAARKIGELLREIPEFDTKPSKLVVNIDVKDNTNWSGHQIIGCTNVNFGLSTNSLNDKPELKRKSYGHEVNSHIVGFNDEIETLLSRLLQRHGKTLFVSIVGQGGSGKTTLAKHIYHQPQVNTHFDCKAWVCVSSSWDKTSILNSIWRQVNQDFKAPKMDYDQLVECLPHFLYSKSYLVILDDIWDRNAWSDISPALPSNSRRKVVVTTRIKDVIRHIGRTVVKVELKPLKDHECLELFRRNASMSNEGISHDLLPCWRKMVRKCQGLPLAIVALAGVLGMDGNQSSWKRISQKMLKMESDSTKGVVKDILALSYYELPHYLKPCVLYLCLFPEDYVIEARNLARLWMAEGFVREEYEAEEYLIEMAQRHIIESMKKCHEGKIYEFQIHDLMRQMLVDVNQERGFLKDSLRLAPTRTMRDGVPEINFSNASPTERDEYLRRILGLDTVLLANSHARSAICFDFVMPHYLIMQRFFERFRVLRVLVLDDINHVHIPKEIGKLVHLRYLELKGYMDELPESIENLGKLWTLDLSSLRWSFTTQVNWWKLKELRHLYFSKSSGPCEMKKLKLERLQELKTLWNVKGGEWMLSGLPNLSDALREFCIIDIQDREQLMAVFRTPSLANSNLHTLELTWKNPVKLHELSSLSKCKSLKKLKLVGAIEASTPIVFPSDLNQLEMRVTHLKERKLMSKINESCPHLKTLILGPNAYVRSRLVCDADSFPQLEKLELGSLGNLKWWIIEERAMPKLHHLVIRNCKRLDLKPEGWKCILEIPQESLRVVCPEFRKKLGSRRKNGMDQSQK